jgi:predicted Zn-dependent protease
MNPTYLRTALLSASIALSLGLGLAGAQENSLPDIGSSAGELITPQQEAEYGAYMLYQLRHMGYLLDDPLLQDWLEAMGQRVGSASDTPEQTFTFFLLRERQINAFATLGGYVGTNAGLVLTADNEDEVAGVLAHEVSHVTQRHVVRAVERAQRDQLPILLAMIGAIAVAQQSDSQDAANASTAAIIGAQALAAQRQINYTRSNESEADRVGIQTLARSGYRAGAIADFFERMQLATRSNSGGTATPEYLRSHPVTITRIAEARDRAERLAREQQSLPRTDSRLQNPLLPPSLTGNASLRPAPLGQDFAWAKERLRVLSADSPQEALAEYRAIAGGPASRLEDPQRYGMAVALLRAGQPAAAVAEFEQLLQRHRGNLWIEVGLAQAHGEAGRAVAAAEIYENLLRRFPDRRSVRLSYAESLVATVRAEEGRRAQNVLRPLLADHADDPLMQRLYGRASEIAGDEIRAGEAYAEASYLNGRAEDAVNQLERLKRREDLDYVQRARIEARIAQMMPMVLELRRQGIEAEDQGYPDG